MPYFQLIVDVGDRKVRVGKEVDWDELHRLKSIVKNDFKGVYNKYTREWVVYEGHALLHHKEISNFLRKNFSEESARRFNEAVERRLRKYKEKAGKGGLVIIVPAVQYGDPVFSKLVRNTIPRLIASIKRRLIGALNLEGAYLFIIDRKTLSHLIKIVSPQTLNYFLKKTVALGGIIYGKENFEKIMAKAKISNCETQ